MEVLRPEHYRVLLLGNHGSTEVFAEHGSRKLYANPYFTIFRSNAGREIPRISHALPLCQRT